MIKTNNKKIQISEELFINLVKLHICKLDNSEIQELIETELSSKLDAIINRELYTKYKTAQTQEERDKARIEYLERKGISTDYRW